MRTHTWPGINAYELLQLDNHLCIAATIGFQVC